MEPFHAPLVVYRQRSQSRYEKGSGTDRDEQSQRSKQDPAPPLTWAAGCSNSVDGAAAQGGFAAFCFLLSPVALAVIWLASVGARLRGQGTRRRSIEPTTAPAKSSR